jgi:hypothetical protein
VTSEATARGHRESLRHRVSVSASAGKALGDLSHFIISLLDRYWKHSQGVSGFRMHEFKYFENVYALLLSPIKNKYQ